MGQRFYYRFVVIQNLSAPLVLGIDFMMRTSVVIQVPSKTVVLGDVSEATVELEGVVLITPSHNMLGLQAHPWAFLAICVVYCQGSFEKFYS